jgi:hypothetical protein
VPSLAIRACTHGIAAAALKQHFGERRTIGGGGPALMIPEQAREQPVAKRRFELPRSMDYCGLVRLAISLSQHGDRSSIVRSTNSRPIGRCRRTGLFAAV